MTGDDTPVGRLLTRREAVALLGASGAASLLAPLAGQEAADPTGGRMPMCVARPAQTEGPYFVDSALNRADIRSDPATGETKPGLPLEITFEVSRLAAGGGCTPLPGAQVDLWHCDALGVYSGVRDRAFDTAGQSFLRGFQVTDAQGNARFTTIYPGWYQGRTVHLHFKIRTDPGGASGYELTSQVYFVDALTDRVHGQAPYAAKGRRRHRNDGDGIFRRGGEQLVLTLAETAGGYHGIFRIALDLG